MISAIDEHDVGCLKGYLVIRYFNYFIYFKTELWTSIETINSSVKNDSGDITVG